MYGFLNFANRKWNQIVFWFHDFSVRLDIGWMVRASVWAHDKMYWELPEKYRTINGVPLREYKLERELEVARHQIQYYANYASDLQWQLCSVYFPEENDSEQSEVEEEKIPAAIS